MLAVIVSVFELDSEKVIIEKEEINPRLIIPSPNFIFLLSMKFNGSTREIIIIATIGRINNQPKRSKISGLNKAKVKRIFANTPNPNVTFWLFELSILETARKVTKLLKETILNRTDWKKFIVKKVNPKNVKAENPEMIAPSFETFLIFIV